MSPEKESEEDSVVPRQPFEITGFGCEQVLLLYPWKGDWCFGGTGAERLFRVPDQREPEGGISCGSADQ